MSVFTDFLVKMILPTAEMAAESALEPVLDDLHASNPNDYVALVTSLHAGFAHLSTAVAKSKSTILKDIIASLESDINSNAAKNGVTFPA